MWFVGAIIGFILGVAADSGAAMFFFALFGAAIGHLIGRSMKKGQGNQDIQPEQRQTGDNPIDLRQRIIKLEGRLQTLEREMAELKASMTKAADASASVAIVEPSESAAVMAGTIEDTEKPVQVSAARNITDANLHLPAVAPIALEFGANAGDSFNTPPPIPVDSLPELSLDPALLAEPVTAALESAGKPELAAMAASSSNTKAEIGKPVVAWPARPSPTPPKTLKESLPAPLAKLIFGGNALVKTGVLILFLGLAFLLRYTAERVTVPVELRYTGVALTGVVLLALGWALRNKRRDYALILQGMAIGVFYLTTLSAMKMNALLSPEVGFAFMFVVSLLSAVLAVLQNAPVLAIVAALEGFATPVLTATGENRPMGLFTYMAVLDIGIFVVAWFNAWRVLNLIGFVGTFTLALGWAEKNYTDSQYGIVQAFLIFFFVLFALIGLLFARRTLQEAQAEEGPLASLKRVGRVDSALVFGNPVTAFGMQYILVRHSEFGAAFSALAVGFFYMLLARLVFSKTRQGLALLAEAYVIVAAIFATLAIPLGLEGTWTGAAWAIEGAGMYWLGIRQQRPYARGFAYAVMVGATYKLLHGIYLNPQAGMPLLQGSWLGPLLLALSCFVVWNLYRKAREESIAKWEAVPSSLLPWLGTAAIALLPWMFLIPQFAAAALALLALAVLGLARRHALAALFNIAASLQAVALASFMLTLHAATAGQAALADGWRGGLAAIIIALSILYSAGSSMLAAKRAAQAQSLPPAWSLWNNLAVVAGCALLHLAMLFAVDLMQAALIWPLTSCFFLWAALRMSHGVLASFVLGLQVISAGLFIVSKNKFGNVYFAHLGFFVPMSLAVAAWFSGDRVRAEAARMRSVLFSLSGKTNHFGSAAAGGLPSVWLNPWCTGQLALGLPVAWGLGWWLLAWFAESLRALEHVGLADYSSAAVVAISLLTSLLLAVLAGWRAWPQMALATCISLPLLVFAGLIGLAAAKTVYLPSAYLGWLAWPIALAWHLYLLKKQQAWLPSWPRLLTSLHVIGFWFFLLQAAREVQAQFASLAAPVEGGVSLASWPLLGWVLVPALVFWFIGSKALTRRWPLTVYRKTYLELACVPVALYLLAWSWISNAYGVGDAHPLPYLPLINPLELGQWLVLASLMHWWRALPETVVSAKNKQAFPVLAGATGLALLTGMVLRSCHHFAGVPWEADALFASRLSQAAVSITWAVSGVAAMLFGNRRLSRTIWAAGAVLLGVVVLKLFLIELADHGGLYRIVSFIGVGILLLVVGYFAPVPVKPKSGGHTEFGQVAGEPDSNSQTRQDRNQQHEER